MDTKDAIEWYKTLVEQATAQQEARDRWYKFYLTIAGAVLLLITTVVSVTIPHGEKDIRLLGLLASLCFLLSGIGVVFLAAYIRQGLHIARLFHRMNYVETEFLISQLTSEAAVDAMTSLVDDKVPVPAYRKMKGLFNVRYRSADRYTVLINILLNAYYASLGALCILSYSLKRLPELDLGVFVGLTVFVIACALQELVRRQVQLPEQRLIANFKALLKRLPQGQTQ